MGFFSHAIYAEDNKHTRNFKLAQEWKGPVNLRVVQYKM